MPIPWYDLIENSKSKKKLKENIPLLVHSIDETEKIK